jgi:tripartite-type tricarboxylate transporter receptor subunit TctC
MTQELFRKLAAIGTLLFCLVLVAHPVLAQEFPKKQPIKIIVPYNPGGGTDALARVTAEFLQRRLGQAVVVENRAGASSAIGADYVAKAPPDGYTLLFVAGGDLTALPAVRSNLPYKFDEFAFLIRGFTAEPMLLASPRLPVSTTSELISYMKANPGKVTLGTPGLGHIVHLGMAMLESAAGVKALVVPYNGSGPVYTEMLAGNIDITLATPPFPDGLKVLGSVGSRRNPMYPNAPLIEEIGIRNASWDNWFGVVGPPHLPKPIADRLIEELGAVLKAPEAVAKFQAVAKTPPDADPLTGEAFKRRVIEEYNRWKAVVTREKISVQ